MDSKRVNKLSHSSFSSGNRSRKRDLQKPVTSKESTLECVKFEDLLADKLKKFKK